MELKRVVVALNDWPGQRYCRYSIYTVCNVIQCSTLNYQKLQRSVNTLRRCDHLILGYVLFLFYCMSV